MPIGGPVKAVILCGGLGTRLREETEFRPKPMVEVGGRPILWHILKTYQYFDIKDFILCLGYKAEVIKEYFLSYKAMNSDITLSPSDPNSIQYHEIDEMTDDFQVTLAHTGETTMTGGRLLRVKKYIGSDKTFVLTYGDGVSDVDIEKLVVFHKSHGKLATVTALSLIHI